MTRDEREAMAARWIGSTKEELADEIGRELDLYLRLKAERCPDLRPSIDRLTVLLTIWRDRKRGAVLHRGVQASVDSGGDLWVTRIGQVGRRLLLAEKRAVAIEREVLSIGDERPTGRVCNEDQRSATREAREAEHRRKMDAVLAAGRAILGRGDTLTMAAIAAQCNLPYSSMQGLVRSLKHRGEWPEGWDLGKAPPNRVHSYATANGPRPSADPPGPDEARWVDLPGLRGWQGTIDGRVRRSPDWVPGATGRPAKIPAGTEMTPRGPQRKFILSVGGGGKKTITRIGVARLVARVTGETVPDEMDGRTRVARKNRQGARAVAG